jgi:hypothetical protein
VAEHGAETIAGAFRGQLTWRQEGGGRLAGLTLTREGGRGEMRPDVGPGERSPADGVSCA